MSSDGGLLLLRQADEGTDTCRWFADCLPDPRDGKRIRHDRLEQVRQRVYQIAMGYEDCNDSQELRHDPMLKVVCDRRPDDDEDALSSQPTLSRFENAVSGRTLNQLRQRLEESYVLGLPTDTHVVVLDIDSTDDETHGRQQLSFFHGFYDQHMYHPLLVFDGESGQLVSALLRPGNAHAARSATSLLRGLIRRIKARFPQAQVVVRADAGFCVPRLLVMLEGLDAELGDVDYVIGIAKNPRLLAMAETTMAQARRWHEQSGRHVRHFSTCSYAAETWGRQRHIITKAEHASAGPWAATARPAAATPWRWARRVRRSLKCPLVDCRRQRNQPVHQIGSGPGNAPKALTTLARPYRQPSFQDVLAHLIADETFRDFRRGLSKPTRGSERVEVIPDLPRR